MTTETTTEWGIWEPNWNLIPIYMQGGVKRYIEEGRRPGHFLSAVFSNDLAEAVARADDTNQQKLVNYITFLYTYAPSGSWGSKENFESWIKQGGLKGLKTKEEVK